eukprot:6197663-Pleurochrysis_carterae.AAC.5
MPELFSHWASMHGHLNTSKSAKYVLRTFARPLQACLTVHAGHGSAAWPMLFQSIETASKNQQYVMTNLSKEPDRQIHTQHEQIWNVEQPLHNQCTPKIIYK